VYRAYQELWALGYLESRPGSYSTVRGRLKPPGAAAAQPSGKRPWEALCPPESRRVHQDHQDLLRLMPRPDPVRVISFAGLSADRELCPARQLRGAIREVLLRSGKSLLDYGDPQGYGPLREVIARRMRIHGVSVVPEEVLVTGGSQHALDLVLRLLGRPGSLAAVESPTYSHVLPLFRFQGIRFLELPMREDGLDLDALERRLKKQRPSLLYTIPNFHNPTGITTSQAHRERLLALCEGNEVPLVEDGFEEEMKYFGKAVLPVKSMDTAGIVIYLGTFSKVVFPGLRVGWIAGEREIVQRLLSLSRFSSLSGNQVTQAAVARFCEDGRYEQHLRRVHRAYRSRMTAMLRSLRQHLPSKRVSWTQPAGGYTLWVTLDKPPEDEGALLKCLDHHGVAAAAGSLFFPERPRGLCFRLSVSNQTEEQIEEGCRRLGRALSKFMGV
jgi:DNA-binding transcriptional MocR family regulator